MPPVSAEQLRKSAIGFSGGVTAGKQMSEPKQIDVVRLAYQLWQKAGEPEGRDEEFYHQATRELREDAVAAVPNGQNAKP